MPYLLEVLLFLAPFLLYGLWVRLVPARAPRPHVLMLALLGILCALAGAVWYGLSRGMAPGSTYVPPHMENGRIAPAGTARQPPGPGKAP